MDTKSFMDQKNKASESSNNYSLTPLTQRSTVMKNAKKNINSLKKMQAVVMIMLMAFSVVMAGTLKNKNTITNNASSTISAGNIQNYNAGTGGTINNSGTINVTDAAGNFDNNLGTATVVVNSGGKIDMQGATSTYANGAGTTNIFTFTNGLLVKNALTNSGTFNADGGRVEYNGTGQTILSIAYGVLATAGTGSNTLPGAITAGAVEILETSTLSTGNFKLTVDSAGITGAGTFTANSGANSEVDYAADNSQAIYTTTYSKLTLSGALSARTKTASGAVTVSGTLTVGTNNTFDANGALTLTGATVSNSNVIRASAAVTTTDSMAINGTFEYDGATQTIASAAYTNLTLTTGDFTFTNGKAYSVTGTYTNGGASRTYGSSSFWYAGTGAQTVGVGDTYGFLGFYGDGVKTITGGTVTATIASGDAVIVDASVGSTSGSLTIAASGILHITSGDLNNEGDIVNSGTITVD